VSPSDIARFRIWLRSTTADDQAPLTVHQSHLLGGQPGGEPGDLVVRIDHRECLRRGLGLRADVIAKIPGSATLTEAMAMVAILTEKNRRVVTCSTH
jgi:hypothetical protein